MRLEFRVAVFAAMLGFTAVLTPGCPKPCGPDTCSGGCCDSAGKCQAGNVETSCGIGGATCGSCAEGQVCTDQACVAKPVEVVDAGPPPCTKDDDCTESDKPICETGKCIAKCKNDLECSRSMNGSICDLMGGKCAPARVGTRLGQGCSLDAECQESGDQDDPCFRGGPGCICHKTDAPAATNATGTCRRRLQSCQECSNDDECGTDSIIFGPPEGIGVGKCAGFMGDVSGKKYCRYAKVGQCPCGTIDDNTGFCKPQTESCTQVGCNSDRNCPSGSVCTVSQPDAGAGACGGICVPRCKWDFIEQKEIAPGCPPGQTCWVDQKSLDPNSIFYGSGRCKPPCQGDNDCKQSLSNPFGGESLACRPEKIGGAMSPNRCRANGACMDNAECPERNNVNDPYLGYCDRAAFTCETDCRTGDDPVTGQAYRDCRSPFGCITESGARICKKLTCVQQGGAGAACSTGEYCCGEDKNSDGSPDPCPPIAQQNDVGCYKAPEPPFCQTCMNDQECNNKPLPAYLLGAGACANGSLSPSCSPLPMRCVRIAQNMMTMATVSACMPSTVNDRSAVSANSSRTKADRGCPVNYDERPIRVDFTGDNSPNYCNSDSDCNQGTDAGRCGPDPVERLRDGGVVRSCICPAGSRKSQCPNNEDAGIESECLDGVPGSSSYCITSYVCQFPQSRYFASNDGGFGCGFTPP